MEQHPIPQNISSYEFRLVGDMTLKQFFQLAGGMLVAYLIYRTPLIGIVKYPLMGVSILVGVTMAFIPVNGRPFGRWIVAFIRAIYSPTQFVWSAPIAIPTIVSPSAPAISGPTPSTNSTITEFTNPPTDNSDPKSSTINQTSPPKATLLPDTKVLLNTTTISSDPKQINSELINSKPASPIDGSDPSSRNQPLGIKNKSSEEQTIFINMKPKAEMENQDQKTEIMQPVVNNMIQTTNSLAQITSQIATPTRPNVLTGIAVNKDTKPLDGVIIEIIDAATGIPSRALRTNRTGIFQIVTPLSSGTYTIIAEKEGLNFDPINIEAKNDIIQPIILTSK